MNTNISISNPLITTVPMPRTVLNTKSKLKRKRFAKDGAIYNKKELNELDDTETEKYNSSSRSSTSSDSSLVLKATKIKHGQKMLITEDKMSEALKDLQIEIEHLKYEEVKSVDMLPKSSNQGVDHDQEDTDDELAGENGIIISNELKAKLNEYQYQNMLIAAGRLKEDKLIKFDKNKMQLMIWSPPPPLSSLASNVLSEESDDESTTSTYSTFLPIDVNGELVSNPFYKVEEPSDSIQSKKNRLKRKYSQVNKINIEEMINNSMPVIENKTTFYLVDEENESSEVECRLKKQGQNKPQFEEVNLLDKSGVQIIELFDKEFEVKKMSTNNSEEKMDI